MAGSTNIMMKLAGVEGESVQTGYEGWMYLSSCSIGGHQSATMHTGRGGGGGKVAMGDLMCTKLVDKCTPDLIKKLCAGQHYATVDVHFLKSTGDTPLPYYQIALKDAIVSSHNTGAAGEESQINESFSLNFRTIKVTYKIQNEDGTDGGATETEFDIAINKITI
ncbi:type VI secretion system tube protein Hcp [Alphaproteobacteria bacterium KMM 3653]|uniref:Type VI secretion system tube protein Hcp n=1 Tax=Harenicola maris TaxID=2841044 RepID=A0AAP2G3W8_9RHOB|nr:type VI secretion system tube protein Hcp [Harenicola maris]